MIGIGLILGLNLIAAGQTFNILYNDSDNRFVLQNPHFSRTIEIDQVNDQIKTVSFINKPSGHEYITQESPELSFTLDGTEINSTACNCFVLTDNRIQVLDDRRILALQMEGKPGTSLENIHILLNYEVYPDLAAVRKWVKFTNTGKNEVRLENICMEDMLIDPGNMAEVDIYKGYGREWTKPPYTGTVNDPAIFVRGSSGGFILGNESPGMMKYTTVFKETNTIKIGLTPGNHDYPFRRYLSPDESFSTPESFIILTDRKSPEEAFEMELGHYMRRYMGIKLYTRNMPPRFLYNTWNPFRTNIDDTLIYELADHLENTGVEYLIIDDGWQDHNGDWNVNPEKFPGGLKPVTDYIRNKGLKPGLWISLTIAEKESEAFRKYQHLAVKDIKGNPANLHGWSNNLEILTMEIASPWYDYIRKKMTHLVREYGITYYKIDLGMVKSAYIMEPARSGSYDENEWFKNREESLYLAFEKTMQLFDELSTEFPELIIDCTFELWGDWHLIDYALAKHADVDWIANFEASPPEGSRMVRSLAYHRGLTVPASSMVIGNQRLEATNHQFSFLSNMGSTPIMLGDPRKLSTKEKAWYQKMSGWLKKMNEKYEVFKYYQTSGVFNPPSAHNWDGFARFNDLKGGGIFCVFRNQQPDKFHSFILPWCRENHYYEIIEAESGNSLGRFSGKVLKENGILIEIEKANMGKAFEIQPLTEK